MNEMLLHFHLQLVSLYTSSLICGSIFSVFNLLISCGSTHVFNKEEKSSPDGLPARNSGCSRLCTRRSSALSSSKLRSHIVPLALAVVKSTANPSRAFESMHNSMISSSLRSSTIQSGSSIFSNTSVLLSEAVHLCGRCVCSIPYSVFYPPCLVGRHLNIGIKMFFCLL